MSWVHNFYMHEQLHLLNWYPIDTTSIWPAALKLITLKLNYLPSSTDHLNILTLTICKLFLYKITLRYCVQSTDRKMESYDYKLIKNNIIVNNHNFPSSCHSIGLGMNRITYWHTPGSYCHRECFPPWHGPTSALRSATNKPHITLPPKFHKIFCNEHYVFPSIQQQFLIKKQI